ncbi:MAG: class I SAM-dependent methyltransferase [Thermoleophilia bacterium]|nr:class I SAM-dependent methyltransferase [Thermoleophilia bacterium]
MTNPWLEIPLDDYEAHMTLPAVGQAELLADRFAAALAEHRPLSVAVLGCAGGNGFDRVAGTTVRRLVGIDLNPAYLAEAERRYRPHVPGLELHVRDLEEPLLEIEPVDLVYAALVFEYLDPGRAWAGLRHLCRPGGAVEVVLQLPGRQATVTPSPYPSLRRLEGFLRLVEPGELAAAVAGGGFQLVRTVTIELPSGKSFAAQTFRAGRSDASPTVVRQPE